MDSISAAEKVQTIKNYKNCQFLNNLILHSVTALLCALFCSYPFWFPPFCSSGKHLLFVSLPNLISSFFNPKCLFIIGNAIIAFLVAESKFANSQSSLASPIEGGFVDERSRTIHEVSNQLMEKKEVEKLEGNESEESVKKIIEDKYMAEKEKGGDDNDEELVKDIEDDGDEHFDDTHDSQGNEFAQEEERDEEEEEEPGLPTEELTKRVEDFIARVNRQRWLEARLEDYGRGGVRIECEETQ